MLYDIIIFDDQAAFDAGLGRRIIEGLTHDEAFFAATRHWLEIFPIVALQSADRGPLEVYRRGEVVH